MTTNDKICYLIQGPPTVGKTTFGRKRAEEEGGVCLSFDDFFYKIVNPDEPEVYNFDKRRLRSSTRWFWLQLKDLCDKGVTPIYIDQNNVLQSHTWRTAAFVMERYNYEVELIHPDSPHWQQIRPLLADKETKEANAQAIKDWAAKLSMMTEHNLTEEKMHERLLKWEEYTLDDLIDQF